MVLLLTTTASAHELDHYFRKFVVCDRLPAKSGGPATQSIAVGIVSRNKEPPLLIITRGSIPALHIELQAERPRRNLNLGLAPEPPPVGIQSAPIQSRRPARPKRRRVSSRPARPWVLLRPGAPLDLDTSHCCVLRAGTWTESIQLSRDSKLLGASVFLPSAAGARTCSRSHNLVRPTTTIPSVSLIFNISQRHTTPSVPQHGTLHQSPSWTPALSPATLSHLLPRICEHHWAPSHPSRRGKYPEDRRRASAVPHKIHPAAHPPPPTPPFQKGSRALHC